MKIFKVYTDKDIPENYTGIVEYPNRDKYWYMNGLLHRKDGPAAVFSSGEKHWYLNGKKHREDGPAIEWTDGVKDWYLNDIYLSRKDIDFLLNLGYPMKITIKLTYFNSANRK